MRVRYRDGAEGTEEEIGHGKGVVSMPDAPKADVPSPPPEGTRAAGERV